MPLDIGRVTHLTDQMHRSEDDAGDPIDEGLLLGADGARGHTWYDPSTIGSDPDLDTVLALSSGQDIADALTGAAAPDAGNVFATIADLAAFSTGRWELAVITGSPPDPLYADGDFLYILVP